MTLKLMTRFLDGHQIEYAQREPSVSLDGLPAEDSEPVLARTVLLNIDGSAAMAVIPAGHALRTELLQELIEAEYVRPVESGELSEFFPDCDLDAIPPLGTLHGMRVFIAESLSRGDRLVFCAGSRSRVIEMPWRDYFRLVVPLVAPISSVPAPQTRGRVTRAQEQELCLR